jgi:hypothetical protein
MQQASEWKFTKAIEKWPRGKTSDGIDWFSYDCHILQVYLVPFM